MRQILMGLLVLLLTPMVATAQVQVEPAAILADAEWQKEYDAYQPGYGLTAALHGAVAGGGVSIDVYFAEWCEDSRLEVPRFIKLVDELASPDLELRYFAGIEHKAEEQKYYVSQHKVEKVPTFIVYRDRRELGRIVEHPTDSLLEDLLEIVY